MEDGAESAAETGTAGMNRDEDADARTGDTKGPKQV